MTTGRINQVTILAQGPEPLYDPEGQSSSLRGNGTIHKVIVSAAARKTPELGYTGLSCYPIAPTEFPTRWSATQEL